MLRCLTLLTVLWCVGPSFARAWTCESAYNLAANSARLYVSQTFAKVERGELTLERAHSGLLSVMRIQGLRPTESRENKLCYYQGLWQGLADQLAIEYRVLGLSCLERPVLSAYAGAVLSALANSLKATDAFDEASSRYVFDAASSELGVPWCSFEPRATCVAAISGQASAAALERYGALVEGLSDRLCGVPPPEPDAPGDAGVSDAGEADAGVSGGAPEGDVLDAGPFG
jgi:hypothetical protein